MIKYINNYKYIECFGWFHFVLLKIFSKVHRNSKSKLKIVLESEISYEIINKFENDCQMEIIYEHNFYIYECNIAFNSFSNCLQYRDYL